MQEPLAATAVVQLQARRRLVLAVEGGRLHVGVGEAQVLVQVVEAVQEVTHVSAQHAQDALVTIATDVLTTTTGEGG